MRFTNVCKWLALGLLLFVLAAPAFRGQTNTVSTPIHSVPFNRNLPLQSWGCSQAMATAGTHMLDFLDTNGAGADYVDCHGVVHASPSSVSCGAPGEVCYNNAGALGGIPGSAWDGTTITFPRLATPRLDTPFILGTADPLVIQSFSSNYQLKMSPIGWRFDSNSLTPVPPTWVPHFEVVAPGSIIYGGLSLGSMGGGPGVVISQCTGVGAGDCDFGTFSSDLDFQAWISGGAGSAATGVYEVDFGVNYPARLICNITPIDFTAAWDPAAAFKLVPPTGAGADDTNSVAIQWTNGATNLPGCGQEPCLGVNVICFLHGGP